jgi:hypothetical protein
LTTIENRCLRTSKPILLSKNLSRATLRRSSLGGKEIGYQARFSFVKRCPKFGAFSDNVAWMSDQNPCFRTTLRLGTKQSLQSAGLGKVFCQSRSSRTGFRAGEFQISGLF